MTPFEQAFSYTIDIEKGVYTNHPNDSGGPTKWGITQRSYIAFLGRYVTAEEIAALTREEAMAFYHARHWAPMHCDRVPDRATSTAIFDASVLYGVGTAALFVQESLSACGFALKLDGILGDKSIDALNKADRKEFFSALHRCVLERIDSVVKLNPKNEIFRKGWLARADRLLTLESNSPLMREVT